MSRADLTGLLLAFVARLITGAQGHWKGCPPKAEQRIYFANHQSHLDWVLIWAALPRELRAMTRPIAARDYWTASPLRQWLTTAVFRAVYVERSAPRATAPVTASATAPATAPATPEGVEPTSVAEDGAEAGAGAATPSLAEPGALTPLLQALAEGDSLVIFPEGTRSAKGDPQPFKSGLYHLAQAFPQVQLIPAWIDNVQRVMPKGEVVPVPVLCTVTFGTPIQLQPGEDRRVFLDRARQAVLAARPEAA